MPSLCRITVRGPSDFDIFVLMTHQGAIFIKNLLLLFRKLFIRDAVALPERNLSFEKERLIIEPPIALRQFRTLPTFFIRQYVGSLEIIKRELVGAAFEPTNFADAEAYPKLRTKIPNPLYTNLASGKQSNWIRTLPDTGWFPILRLYGPLESWIDGSWKPGDLEEVKI